MAGDVLQRLRAVQANLKAPKDKYNSFGKYKYRSCESILEAVKPLLSAQELTLTVSDEVVQVGERTYVRATARVVAPDGVATEATAFAREPDAKKGMDSSQVTGAASSYARKYALNGLFLIDDAQDADAARPPQDDGEPFVARCQSCGTSYTFESQEQLDAFALTAQCCPRPDWRRV